MCSTWCGEESKAYRLYVPIGKKLVVSRDVIFDEGEQWNWDTNTDEAVKVSISETPVEDVEELNSDTDSNNSNSEEAETRENNDARAETKANNDESRITDPPIEDSES